MGQDVYFFTGEDEFRKNLSLERLKDKLLGSGRDCFNCEVYYSGQVVIKELICSLETVSVTGKKKLVILKDFEELAEEGVSALNNYLSANSPKKSNAILAILAKTPFPKNNKSHNSILKYCRVFDFPRLKADDACSWIMGEFKSRHKTIDRHAASIIYEETASDLSRTYHMIEQITDFVGDRDKVKVNDVAKFSQGVSEGSTFKFFDYVSAKDIKRSLEVLEVLLYSGIAASNIIGMLNWHMARLISVKKLLLRKMPGSEIARLLNLNIGSNNLNRLINQAGNFSIKQLRKNLKTLFDTDLMLKRANIRKTDFLLEMLIVKLCS